MRGIRSIPSLLILLGLFAGGAAFLLYPIWLTVSGGFETGDPDGPWTLYHVLTVFEDPTTRAGLFNAFGIAIITTLVSLIIALPAAESAAPESVRPAHV